MSEFVERSLTRPDGRKVAWTEWGDPTGRVVLRIPGTPGSRYSGRADVSPWVDRGLRMVVTERPGFGASTPLPGRGYHEHADDLVAILDALDVDSVPVAGGSGAAPHILALAANHPTRVAAATIVVGTAPTTDDEIDEMIEMNARAARFRREGRFDELRELLEANRVAILADPLAGIRAVMSNAPPEDQAIMGDPAWQATFERAAREALEQGVDGWYDESLAKGSYDDIALDNITCSITWWHGEQDRNCPISSARRLLERLPTAKLNVWSDGGHLTGYHHEGSILDELLARAVA
jgi:pimeloyl-ACP methyl ester carboxylesterase